MTRTARPEPGEPATDLVERYLPRDFFVRIRERDRAWRGRIILMLWVVGYPLGMAWSLGLTDDVAMVAFYRDAVSRLDDARLIAALDASVDTRGDGSEFSFWSLGDVLQ